MPVADSFDSAFAELGIDPAWASGGFTGGVSPPYLDPSKLQGGPVDHAGPYVSPEERAARQAAYEQGPKAPPAAAPQAGQFANNQQGFLDWATQKFGAGKRGGGFVDIPPGQLQQVAQQYAQATGNTANFLGGPSGDRIDFGQGAQDALTSGGSIWNPAGGNGGAQGGSVGGPVPWGGGGPFPGGGSPGTMGMPTAPTATDLKAPDPFTYQLSNLGQFQSPSQTPTPERLSYQNATAPGQLTAQQVGTPQQLSYNPMLTPTAFAGSRQADPGTLSYANLATPAGYTPEKYQGLSAEQLAADPSYQFRFQQGQGAAENILAHAGALRTGNAAKALTDYGQQAASQEYAAADARARGTVAQNNATSLGAYQTNAQTGLAYNQNANANAMNFGQQNIQNSASANEANYGRSSNEAQQGFQNQFAANQANNAGQFQVGQANIGNQLNATQANNQSNLAYGGQNFQQGFAVNQANNAGQQSATQANNANALAAQGQQFGQAATGYGLNQAAQQQGYNQALGAYGQNAQTQLAYGSQNQNNQLANYQAQTNAALGLGNLNLGYQNSAQNYALGQGNLNLGYGNLGLAQQGQQFNQGLQTYDRNYQANVTDPWNQQMGLANLGNPGAPNTQGNANAQSGLQTDIGNANAAGTVGAANQWNNAASNLSQTAQQAAYLQWLRTQPQARSMNQLPSQ